MPYLRDINSFTIGRLECYVVKRTACHIDFGPECLLKYHKCRLSLLGNKNRNINLVKLLI